MIRDPETYEELIRYKRCVDLTKYYELTESQIEKIYDFLESDKEGKIKSSRPIKFGNNQYAYVSLKEKCDYETLKDLIARKKPKLFRVIRALKRDNGILTKHELINISGCVSEKKGNNLVYDEIISDLENLSMISKTKYKNIEFICFNYV